MISKSNLS